MQQNRNDKSILDMKDEMLEILKNEILEQGYEINIINMKDEKISANDSLSKFPQNISYDYNEILNDDLKPIVISCPNNGHISENRLTVISIIYYVIDRYSKLKTDRKEGLYDCINNAVISDNVDSTIYRLITSKDLEEGEELDNYSFYKLIKLLCVHNLIEYLYSKEYGPIKHSKKILLSVEFMMKYFNYINIFEKRSYIFEKVYEKDTEYIMSKIIEMVNHKVIY